VAPGTNKRGWLYTGTLTAMAGAAWNGFVAGDATTRIVIGVATLLILGVMLFVGERIIRRVRALIKTIGEE
jgi:hypothetical protein